MEWLSCRLNRREFLKLSAATVSATYLSEIALVAEAQPAVLVDTTKCWNCRLCSYACKEANKLPVKEVPEELKQFAEETEFGVKAIAEPLAQLELNPYTWTVIRSVKWNERYVHIKISACTA